MGLKIIYDNAADRATITASTTAGSLVASNMQTDIKSTIWRSTGTSARLSFAWGSPEIIGGVALAYTNLTSSATMRVRASTESSVTNLVTYSERLDQSSDWSVTRATVSANVTTAPDGNTTADALIEDTSSTNTHFLLSTGVSLTASTTYTLSIFVKRGAGSRDLRLWFGSTTIFSGVQTGAVFNLATGAVSSLLGAATATITSYGNGWYRCSITATPSSSGPSTMQLNLHNPTTGSITYNGDGSSSLYLWGAQMEVGSSATSYYPTTSAAATRPAGYIDTWQSYQFDSGSILCAPASPLGLWNWGSTPLGVNAFAYGGGTYGRVWFNTPSTFSSLVVDIADATNSSGYLEVGRAILGNVWTTELNSEYGATTISVIDTSQQYRNDAGDLMTDNGTRHRKQSINLSSMATVDRTKLWNLLFNNGFSRPFLISVYPNNSDTQLEQMHQMYCKLVASPEMSIPYYQRYAAELEMEEV